MENLPADKVERALMIAKAFGGIEGDHHKMWVIDQIVRALNDCPILKRDGIDCNGFKYSYDNQGNSLAYDMWVRNFENGEDGPQTYCWDVGVPP